VRKSLILIDRPIILRMLVNMAGNKAIY